MTKITIILAAALLLAACEFHEVTRTMSLILTERPALTEQPEPM